MPAAPLAAQQRRFDRLAGPATMYPTDDIGPAAITATIASATAKMRQKVSFRRIRRRSTM